MKLKQMALLWVIVTVTESVLGQPNKLQEII